MARLAISNKQINRLVRAFLWRRVTEQALHGSSFVDIPDEINQAYIGDLLRQVVSQGSCKREPPACEHSDWLGLTVWPVVAHVQECCRVVVWMLEQVISATFWTELARH